MAYRHELKSSMVSISDLLTGLIVDKEKGVILTHRKNSLDNNIGEAVFVDGEETEVFPLYTDPIHDFCFWGYDPTTLDHKCLEEITLAPESARLGLQITVLGQESLQTGTLARLDSHSPHYGRDGRDCFYDFNAICMKASSGCTTSGSLLVDKQGKVVAMTAGGKGNEEATTHFLPLERVVRALTHIQNRRSLSRPWEAIRIPRGTLEAGLLRKTFNEALKLGLKWQTEQFVRHASPAGETGMLVVDSVVIYGPAYQLLEPGDFLIGVDGEVVTQFMKLESFLDENVDQSIELTIERAGIVLTLNVIVKSLKCSPVSPRQDLSPPSSSTSTPLSKTHWKNGKKCHICGAKSEAFLSIFSYTNHMTKNQHKVKKQHKKP